MTEFRVVHVVAIMGDGMPAAFSAAAAPTNPALVFEHPAVTVFAIRSGAVYDAPPDERHRFIDTDLDHLRSIAPAIGRSRPELDGRSIGSRWPVVVEVDQGTEFGPDDVEIEVNWDNALFRRCNPELEARLLNVVAIVLARYRVLHETITVCRSLLKDLVEAGIDDPPDEEVERFLMERHTLMAGRVLADPRPDLYWGCENRLLTDLRSSWAIGMLEEAADDAVATTAALSDARTDRQVRRLAEQQASSARRTAVTLRLLAALSGVSAIAGLIEFGGSGNPFQWSLARPVLSGALLLVGAALLAASHTRSRGVGAAVPESSPPTR